MTAVVERWTEYADTITDGLRAMIVTDATGGSMPASEGFARWVAMTHGTHERGGQLFMVGNGGSAAMASHMVTDAVALANLRAFAFNDPAMLTATSNDHSFDEVFTVPLDRLARTGDLLIALSCSGNSPSIVRALQTGRLRGLQTVTVSARQADNRSRSLGDLNFYVPLSRYGWAQCAHQVILHYWFDQYLDLHGHGAV
jgi:D-sedoheptulose 7-phosphate isomerase